MDNIQYEQQCVSSKEEVISLLRTIADDPVSFQTIFSMKKKKKKTVIFKQFFMFFFFFKQKKVRKTQAVILVNCGGSVDVKEAFNTDSLYGFIIDTRRPFHPNNKYDTAQVRIKLIKKSDKLNSFR